jgi:hypothetical protein
VVKGDVLCCNFLGIMLSFLIFLCNRNKYRKNEVWVGGSCCILYSHLVCSLLFGVIRILVSRIMSSMHYILHKGIYIISASNDSYHLSLPSC